MYAGLSAVPAQPVRFGRGDKRKRCSPRGLHRILHRGSRSVASTQAGYGRIRLTQIYRFPFLLRLASLADDHSGAGSGNNRKHDDSGHTGIARHRGLGGLRRRLDRLRRLFRRLGFVSGLGFVRSLGFVGGLGLVSRGFVSRTLVFLAEIFGNVSIDTILVSVMVSPTAPVNMKVVFIISVSGSPS